jgi:hypothetical protein
VLQRSLQSSPFDPRIFLPDCLDEGQKRAALGLGPDQPFDSDMIRRAERYNQLLKDGVQADVRAVLGIIPEHQM